MSWTALTSAHPGLRERLRRLGRPWVLAVLVAVPVIALLASWSRPGPAATAVAGVPVAHVQEGPFRATLTESGTLEALRSVSYGSRIQSNQAKVVALAPEGRMVKQGDLLILFDSAPFQDEIRRSQATLAQARADLEKAQQDLHIQEIENQERLSAARNDLKRSRLEQRDVEEGKGRLKEEESSAAVSNAERALAEAEQNYADLSPLLDEGFITRLELERAAQQVEKARQELNLARRRRETLVDYERPIELSQAQTQTDAAQETARQLASAADHRLEQKRAEIAGAQSRIAEAEARLELARQQLANTEVRADVAGIVVYRDLFIGSERRKPQVGDQVWANQPLLILPDVSKMTVQTRVREIDIHRVAPEQSVEIRVDAYPDLRLTGRVTLIGTLAEAQPGRRGAKYFDVTVEVAESEPRLRPGMTARVEILAEQREHAVFVPLDAVFEREGRSLCYAARGDGFEPREVVLGPSNHDYVVVERGLEAGGLVALVDPTRPAADPALPEPAP